MVRNPFSTACALSLFALSAIAAEPAETVLHRPGKGQAWGYNGDGSSVMDAAPPVKFDVKTGENVRWQAPLPCYGHGSPIVVGGRVLVECDPFEGSDWPLLMCLDAATGKKLWQAELNHLPAANLSDAQRKEAGELWKAVWSKYRFTNKLRAELRNGGKADEVANKLKAAGIEGSMEASGYWKIRVPELAKLGDRHFPFAGAGLTVDTWSTMGNWGAWNVGESFPTPITDGTYVYAATAYGGFFCFDLEGKCRWVKHYPGTKGEYCRNGRSPILYKNLLISDVTALARAMDKATGKLLWSAPVDGEATLTPTVVVTKGGDALVCAKAAFNLPDGTALKVDGWKDFGAMARTKYDEPDVVFFSGGGEHGSWTEKGKCDTPPPAAVRFNVEGPSTGSGQATLKAKVLWAGIDGKPVASHIGLLYHEGKLYHPGGKSGGFVLDPLSGKMLTAGQRGGNTPLPGTGHLLYVAGRNLFGVRQEGGGKAGRDGKIAPAGLVLNVTGLDGKAVASSLWEGSSNYSSAFTLSGDAIYIRSSNALLCVGRK